MLLIHVLCVLVELEKPLPGLIILRPLADELPKDLLGLGVLIGIVQGRGVREQKLRRGTAQDDGLLELNGRIGRPLVA